MLAPSPSNTPAPTRLAPSASSSWGAGRVGGQDLFLFIYLFIYFSLGPHPRRMEVPSLGLKSELQLLAYTIATATRIRAASATYTTAQGNARSLTH